MSTRILTVLLLALAVMPRSLGAQQSRLDGRVDARTRAAVERIIDSARVAGLPAEPLVDKTLEGAMKGAESSRIISAVSALSRRLAAARGALGAGTGDAELVAAAGALSVGVSPATLVRLRDASGEASVATPLVVLSDLVARGVPADTASAALIALAARGASDDAYLALQGDVARAIAAGAPPAVATTVRAAGGLVSSPAAITQRAGLSSADAANGYNSPVRVSKPRP